MMGRERTSGDAKARAAGLLEFRSASLEGSADENRLEAGQAVSCTVFHAHDAAACGSGQALCCCLRLVTCGAARVVALPT